jgi:hypothetical protein
MEPTPRLFRGLVLLSLAAPLIGWALPSTVPGVLLTEDRKLAEEMSKSFVTSLSPPLAILVSFGGIASVFALLGASIASLVGLLKFRWWARRLALLVMSAPLIVSPFASYILVSGIDWAFFYLESTLCGVVLSMAYFSPLSEQFVRHDR